MLYFCIALQIYMWDDFYYGCSSFSEAGDFLTVVVYIKENQSVLE